jgi:transcriptional regulator with XRE-family HTH domain
MPTTVTANINYYRTLIGVTQKELEQALGISRVTFRRRCDTENLTVSDLRIIADKLHIKVIDLMKGV